MSDSSVYTGIWRNYNGLILTLSQNDGRYLIAFVALFVSAAMGHLWSILCFVLHQVRSTRLPQPGLHHQQQALLSNAPGSSSMAWSLLHMAWRWRSRDARAARSSAGLATAALLHVSLLAVASIMSSRFLSAGSEVLARGNPCGFFFWTQRNLNLTALQAARSGDPTDAYVAACAYGQQAGLQTLKYVQDCYGTDETAAPDECRSFTVSSISSVRQSATPCPFSPEICAVPKALEIDTGYVDSNYHLGINTPGDSRLTFRKVLTCVPTLAEEKYSTNWTTQQPGFLATPLPEGDRYKYYLLGSGVAGNYTWVVQDSTFWGVQPMSPYQLSSVTSYWKHFDDYTYMNFHPIPALAVEERDLSIIFLINRAQYVSPTTDPWFRSTHSVPLDHVASSEYLPGRVWVSDRAASVLACTEQYQFCTTSNGGACSPLSGLYANKTTPYLGLRLDDDQKAVFDLVWWAAYATSINVGTWHLYDRFLLANQAVITKFRVSGPLPPDQWRREVANFANAMLAGMQRGVVDFAAPPDVRSATVAGNTTVSSRDFVEPGSLETLCPRIRKRDASFFNFSVAGLAVVLVLGLVIILGNLLCVPGLVFWLHRRRANDKHAYARREWHEGHVLRLHRTACWGRGVGPWEVDHDENIPVMAEGAAPFSGDKLWMPDVSDTRDAKSTD